MKPTLEQTGLSKGDPEKKKGAEKKEGAGRLEDAGGAKGGTSQRGADSPLTVPPDASPKKEGADLAGARGALVGTLSARGAALVDQAMAPLLAEAFEVYEGDLADQLGMSRDLVRELRIQWLTLGLDWEKKGNRVHLTRSAAEFLKKELGATGEPSALPPIEELTVFAVPVRNTRILDCRKACGKAVRVKVNTNVNFVPGMKVHARQSTPEWDDVYDLEGRCPRNRGRW